MENGRIVEGPGARRVHPATATDHPAVRQTSVAVCGYRRELQPAAHRPSAGAIFKLTFVGVQTHQAVIAEVIRRYALTINILHGKISHTLNGSFGELYIHAEGNEQQVADMLSLLHERDIAVEVIQHD